MVVLQESGSPIQAPAAILDFDYRQTTTCLKMLPKRYINVHQWLGPICTKDIKAQIVSVLIWSFIYFLVWLEWAPLLFLEVY